MTTNEILGKRLRNYREMEGIRTIEMATVINRRSSSMSHRESGRTVISALDIAKIKAAYPSFSVDDFLLGGKYDA